MRPPLRRGDGPALGGARAYRERSASALAFRKPCARERFAGYAPHPQLLDTHDESVAQQKLSFLRRRSKVVEIVGARDLILGLTLSGVCAVFDRAKRERLCFVNTSPDEVIRSLFHNEASDALISVSVYRADNFSSLNCRTIPLEYVRAGRPEGGVSLFESECLKWPGFVEFDHVNGKVLTYSAADKAYKLWGMANYELLYAVQDHERNIQELKIAPGVVLLIYARRPAGVPLKVLAIEDGQTLLEIALPLVPDVPVELIELFGPKLLAKQTDLPLAILDVRTGERRTVPTDAFQTPSAFIYLYERERFVTFRQAKVAVWDFSGRLVTEFEDHTLWHTDCSMNNIVITSGQHLLLSYCRRTERAHAVSVPAERAHAVPVGADGGSAAGVGCERAGDSGGGGEGRRDGGGGASAGSQRNPAQPPAQPLLQQRLRPSDAAPSRAPPAPVADGAASRSGAHAAAPGAVPGSWARAEAAAPASADGGAGDGGGGGDGHAPGCGRGSDRASVVGGGAPGARGSGGGGSINVSSIATGRSVARIAARGGELRDVTALWYNEEANEIYVGSTHGTIEVWSNDAA